MDNLDLPTHYLGWQFFREAPWAQWPIGAIPQYSYDAPGSIVLTDSIPLLALLFKAFSAWLPQDFQYFGIWVLCCFLLQAWFACKLLQRFSSSGFFCLAGSVFFATASIYVLRIYMHPALAGHWLVLAAMCLHFSSRFRSAGWVSLLVLATLVHAYLFIMVGAIWVADLIQRTYRRELDWKVLAANVALSIGLVVAVMWAAGYFIPVAVEGTPVRTRANLLFAFWNGQNIYGGSWSSFTPTFQIEPTTGDGFGYFGLGFLLLAACALFLLPRKANPDRARVPRSTWVPLAIVCAVMAICSFSNMVYAGEKLVLSFELPAWLDRLYGVFRGAGRLIWPLWYLLLLASLYQVASKLSKRTAGCLVMVLAVVQCADFIKPAKDIRNGFVARSQWKPMLVSAEWSEISKNYRHVVFILGGEGSEPLLAHPYIIALNPSYKQIADFAAKNDMGINVAYLARFDEARTRADRKRRVESLVSGQFEQGTVYAVTDASLQQRAGCVAPDQVWIGRLDGIDLIVPGGESLPALRALPETACPPR